MMKKPTTADGAADQAGADGEAPALVPEGAGEGEEIGDDEERLGAIAPLETFVVNLSGGRFLRLQVQLEFEGIDIPARFVSRSVPIRDGLIALLTKRNASDLETPKGKEDLKNDIRNVANELMRREDVKRVYFTQFVVQ
jgi:flagellar basal body-associated protein FliL